MPSFMKFLILLHSVEKFVLTVNFCTTYSKTSFSSVKSFAISSRLAQITSTFLFSDSILFATIKFEKIEDIDLRDLNEKLLCRFVSKRISCKEALLELKKLKVERDNYYRGFKRMKTKTPSVILKKENQEVQEFMNYWEEMTTNVRNNFSDFIQ